MCIRDRGRRDVLVFTRRGVAADAELHHAVTARFFGRDQRAIGAAKHGLRRIAGLHFRHAEARRDAALS